MSAGGGVQQARIALDGAQFEVRGRCVPESGRQWDVYVWKVEFPDRDPAGELWDGFGGLPDPKLTVEVNDVVVGSVSADDTYKIDRTGKTFTPIRVTLKTGNSLGFGAFDVDVSSDDYADGSKWTSGIGLAKAYGYKGKLYYQRVSVDLEIRPVP